MKLKYLLYIIPVAMLAACDKVEGPKRENITIDTSCTFTEDNSIPIRKVLVEDYTGFFCGNCPDAALLLYETLKPMYSDTIITMSVHSGYFAIPCIDNNGCGGAPGAFLTDFRTPAGEEWYAFFGITANPIGMINRIGYPSTQRKNPLSWNAVIQSQTGLDADVRIRMLNTYDETTRNVRACIETKFLSNVSGNYKLQVILTEDSIIDWQAWYSPHVPEFVPDYIHRHVLRTSLNSNYGVAIPAEATLPGATQVSGYRVDIDPAWNENQCHIVAFVYNAATYEVLQVEEAAVK
jgi:hypothetical protein